MKKYFTQYKPFLLFLGTFFLVYATLTGLYQFFLSSFEGNKIDTITRMVGHNTQQFLQIFDAKARSEVNETNGYILLFYHDRYVARIIEGCNAISVIILYVSFIVAFSGKIKATLFFVFGGSFLIYVLNVFRIAILCVLITSFPDQEHFLHTVVFPLFIYGVVFILWVVWVNKYSKYAK